MKQRVGLLDFEASALKLGHERKLRNHPELSFRDVPFGKLKMFARQGSIDDGQHNPLTSDASEGCQFGATPNRRE